jgi:hypothetical protein
VELAKPNHPSYYYESINHGSIINCSPRLSFQPIKIFFTGKDFFFWSVAYPPEASPQLIPPFSRPTINSQPIVFKRFPPSSVPMIPFPFCLNYRIDQGPNDLSQSTIYFIANPASELLHMHDPMTCMPPMDGSIYCIVHESDVRCRTYSKVHPASPRSRTQNH